jgi:hypothetical protein
MGHEMNSALRRIRGAPRLAGAIRRGRSQLAIPPPQTRGPPQTGGPSDIKGSGRPGDQGGTGNWNKPGDHGRAETSGGTRYRSGAGPSSRPEDRGRARTSRRLGHRGRAGRAAGRDTAAVRGTAPDRESEADLGTAADSASPWPGLPGHDDVPSSGCPPGQPGRVTLTVPWQTLVGMSAEPGNRVLAGARDAAGVEADRGGRRRRSTHRMEGHRHEFIGRVHPRGARPQATPVQEQLSGRSGRRILRTGAVRGPDRPGHRDRSRRPARPRLAAGDRRPGRRRGTQEDRAQGHSTERRHTEGPPARRGGSRGCGSRGIPRLGRDRARHAGWHAEGRAGHGPASACPGGCRTRSPGGQLRYLLPRGSRTAISSVHPAASHHPGPGPDLPVSRMPATSLALGPGPLDPIPPGRAHVLVQSGARMFHIATQVLLIGLGGHDHHSVSAHGSLRILIARSSTNFWHSARLICFHPSGRET